MPQSLPHLRRVRRLFVIVVLATAGGFATAGEVPLPRERPASLSERFAIAPHSALPAGPVTALAPAPELQPIETPQATSGPSACELRLGELAVFVPLPVLIGPGECGATDVVRLDAVVMPDGKRVALGPPATLRCSMAEAVALWVRQDVAPAAEEFGAPLASI